MWEQIAANQRKSVLPGVRRWPCCWWPWAVFGGEYFMGKGGGADRPGHRPGRLVFMTLTAWFQGDNVMLSMSGAKQGREEGPADPVQRGRGDDPGRGLAARCRPSTSSTIPRPTRSPPAGAPRTASVAVTSGLLQAPQPRRTAGRDRPRDRPHPQPGHPADALRRGAGRRHRDPGRGRPARHVVRRRAQPRRARQRRRRRVGHLRHRGHRADDPGAHPGPADLLRRLAASASTWPTPRPRRSRAIPKAWPRPWRRSAARRTSWAARPARRRPCTSSIRSSARARWRPTRPAPIRPSTNGSASCARMGGGSFAAYEESYRQVTAAARA